MSSGGMEPDFSGAAKWVQYANEREKKKKQDSMMNSNMRKPGQKYSNPAMAIKQVKVTAPKMADAPPKINPRKAYED